MASPEKKHLRDDDDTTASNGKPLREEGGEATNPLASPLAASVLGESTLAPEPSTVLSVPGNPPGEVPPAWADAPEPPTVMIPPAPAGRSQESGDTTRPLMPRPSISARAPPHVPVGDDADSTGPTVNVVPDSSRQTSPDRPPRAATVRTDRDPTLGPWGGTTPTPVHVDLPTAAQRTPRLSAPRPPPSLEGVISRRELPTAPHAVTRVEPQRPSHPVAPLSVLAGGPQAQELTNAGRAPDATLGDVELFTPDVDEQTRVIPTTAPPRRRSRARDGALLGLGAMLVCAGLWLSRSSEHPQEGLGPLPPERLEAPGGYEPSPPVAPKPKAAEAPAPERPAPASTGSSPTPAVREASRGSAGSGSATPSASGGAALAPTHLPLPRCSVNVASSLETRASWVVESKRKLLRLRVSPKREAITRANLFVALADRAENAELVRTENAAVYFDALLDPAPNASQVKVMLGCECGLAQAAVVASVDIKSLAVDVKPTKLAPPESLSKRRR
ncbi:MAG: hypothetical protein IPJ65_00700 [Archangiaceae bacterium]|nr:hypothetical protein [Archangiaceae bacterium]